MAAVPRALRRASRLFVIIALGESLIAAGQLSGADTSAPVALPTVVAAGGLWSTYFSRAKDALEEAMQHTASRDRGRYARDVYSFLHLPIIGGGVGFVVASSRPPTIRPSTSSPPAHSR